MILKVHGSMGDCLMMTGLPEAYHHYTGDKMAVPQQRNPEFWQDNPFVDFTAIGPEFEVRHNAGKDHLIYYPLRAFFEMTEIVAEPHEVRPRIYNKPHDPQDKTIVVNDMAGWPSRVGYPFLNDLCIQLQVLGYRIVYLRNDSYRNCLGQITPREIGHYDEFVDGGGRSVEVLIETIRHAACYVGYDSGLSVIAGALDVPYVLLEAPIPPINVSHPSCIYALRPAGCVRCRQTVCNRNCLPRCRNFNDRIISSILRIPTCE